MLAALRDARWLNAGRVRGYALLIGLASLLLLANSFFKAMGADGSDFLAFWGGGHVAAAGDPAAAYDLAVQQRVQTGTGSTGWFAFVNPPPFLFLAAPFGSLPFPLAWLAWVIAGYAVWAWAAIRGFPRLWPIVLAFPGALLAAGHAQTGFFTGALVVAAVVLLDRRPVLAGVLIGALLIKPHLALLLPFWLVAGGRWRTFLAAGCSAVGLLAAAWLAFGTRTMLAYTTSWQASAAIMRGDDPGFYLRMATPYAMLRPLLGAGGALAVNGGIALALLGLVLLSWRRFAGDAEHTGGAPRGAQGAAQGGALVLAATASASPYLFNYDLPFLILPIAWLVGRGLRDGFRAWERLALVAIWFAPYATRAAALPLGINAMPLFSLLLVWLVWTARPAPRHG
ncbi:MAG: hypothetical protein RLZZ08_314 [Pseudomonadota bacterium]|jgi:hypothetical protein